MAKKKNPVIHLKQSDVKRMKEDATNAGLKHAVLLFFTVMRDKEDYDINDLKRIFDEATELADSINKGYVDWKDLEKALAEEADITLCFE